MGELQFAKQFLTTLDSKSTKYQPTHAFDPKDFATRVPYTLPKLQHPPHPLPPTTNAPTTPPPGSTAAINTLTIVLKSTRNPAMTLTLPTLDPAATSVQTLREAVQSTLGGPGVVGLEKIKILLNKKPIPASKKTVAEALDGTDHKATAKEIELGIMVMGGAPDPPPQHQQAEGPGSENAAREAAAGTTVVPMEGVEKSATEPVATSETSSKAILSSVEFWADLEGFLAQRLKDESAAKNARGIFEAAWKAVG